MVLTKRVRSNNKTIRKTKYLLLLIGLIVSILLLTIGGYSTRRQQELHYDNIQNKNTSANATKTVVVACDIIEPLLTNPGKVNALRRTLQLAAIANHDDECYTNHYLPYFVNYTRSRLLKKKKHLILHM